MARASDLPVWGVSRFRAKLDMNRKRHKADRFVNNVVFVEWIDVRGILLAARRG